MSEQLNGVEFARQIVEAVKIHVAASKKETLQEADGMLDAKLQPLMEQLASIKELADRVMALEKRGLLPGPPGEKGERGEKGDQGIPGRDGRDGLPGAPGDNGKDGRNGTDGKDGHDGLNYEDFQWERQADGRTVKATAKRDGKIISEQEMKFPIAIHRGPYKHDEKYEWGDGVSYRGCTWYAQRDTINEKPDNGSSAWILSVKCGRDGKDGAVGKEGPQGRPGRDGRDLTQMGPDGSKW